MNAASMVRCCITLWIRRARYPGPAWETGGWHVSFTFQKLSAFFFCGTQGFVYLKFATMDAAQKAQMTLNGRWFAGKEVLAEFQFTA
eukprot:scaffold436874_cov47-Prasinocladus_malaysianus.AAC.1